MNLASSVQDAELTLRSAENEFSERRKMISDGFFLFALAATIKIKNLFAKKLHTFD